MNDETLKEILEYDPLDAAALAKLEDTQLSNTLENYTRIIREEGFEKVLEIPFVGKAYSGEEPPAESFQVWFHPDGLLLDFDTFRTTHVNAAKFYFNVRLKEYKSGWNLRCSGGCAKNDGAVFVGDLDAREALRFHIRQLRDDGQLLNPW